MNSLIFNVDKHKAILSSESLFYKTENFIKKTKYVTNLDLLLTKLCETIIFNAKRIIEDSKNLNDIDCFSIKTEDNKFAFMFKFGFQIDGNLNKLDVVFFDYISNATITEKVSEYVTNTPNIKVEIKKDRILVKLQDFNKLYLISNVSNVNLPKLSALQKEIVETVDKNILVQGVAGSGKTNICIDKIIFTSCKNYSGKVLYTTFSRGLLIDTKLKVENYKKDLEQILQLYRLNNIVFLDNNHKKALENRLGIYFFSEDDDKIFDKIERIVNYLTNKVDYLLIEDLYKNHFLKTPQFVGQSYFINKYSKNLANHQIENSFKKLNKYSKEIIYKEIFGMIFGFCKNNDALSEISLQEYTETRKNSFSRQECEDIYKIAQDYKKHCEKFGLLDNNLASRQILQKVSDVEYSLSILDEVQDYTQINLNLFKKLSLKMFCVGDAQQMINPAYFSFAYLKNLLYNKDVTDVKELTNNYRNSKKIEEIVSSLSEINKLEFGTHSFILKGNSIDNGIASQAVYIKDQNFINKIATNNFDNITFVVDSLNKKTELQKLLKNQEILTVSEIKGLERNTIVIYNILTSNQDKWKALELNRVNHKQADENSVYRYYYNLFYVGITRAKQNIFIVETQPIKQFENFFKQNFDNKDSYGAIKKLEEIVSRVEFSQQEFVERINEFIKQEQFDNAKFTANKIKDDATRIDCLRTIEVYETLIHYGKFREAGIKFWEYGLLDKAKEQFTLSGDTILIELIDTCSKNSGSDLNIDIINYFEDVKENKLARNIILDTIKKDLQTLKQTLFETKQNFNKGRK